MKKTITRQKYNPNMQLKSFPLLAVEQFERVMLAHNVEFRGGFYMQVQGVGGSTEYYVPDTREVFCNTCQALAILVEPVLSKATKEKYNEIKEGVKDNEKWFLDKSTVEEEIVLGESFYDKTEDKISREQYVNKKVRIYQELFEILSQEFSTKHYWQTGTVDD